MPRVSVIIPSYNHEKFVGEAIQSVIDQTYQDFEIIITDDGSTDGTVGEIRKFTDPRIRLFIFEQNQGACIAANNCVKEAGGEFVAMLSSDDVFLPNKLEKQVKFLDEHPDIAAVFGYARIIDDAGSDFTDKNHFYYNIFIQPNRTRFEWLNYFFYRANCLCHPTILIRKQCYEDVGYYDPRYAQLPDFDFWIRLCLKYEIYIMPDNLIKFRILSGKANVSAPASKSGATRYTWEFGKILTNYFGIKSLDNFQRIFPEYTRLKFAERIDIDSIPFFLALLAFETDSRFHHNFALTTLYELLHDHSVARKLKENFDFTYINFIKLTGAYNIFNLDTEHRMQLTEKDRQLAQQVRLISEKDAQLIEKNRLLSQKDNQLAESTQQLAAGGQQLAQKDQQLVEKDQQLAFLDGQILAFLSSYSWKFTAPVRWAGTLAVRLPRLLSSVTSAAGNKTGITIAKLQGIKRFFSFGIKQSREYYKRHGRMPKVKDLPSLIGLGIHVYFDSGKSTSPDLLDSHLVELAVVSPLSVSTGKSPYESWLEVNRWNDKREDRLRRRLNEIQDAPLLSVVMPVYDPPVEFLNRAIASVCSQVYQNWELCIAEDASIQGEVREVLMKWTEIDKRIKVCFRETNGNISVATNTAASLATGSHLVFLDQDDVLTPDALGEIALYIDERPCTDILYSDDDKIAVDGKRFAPQFKPDWSPELLLSYMYFSHVFVVSKRLFEEIGGVRSGFEGSQDYDLALRASEKARHVGHIPLVLYHWRVLPNSTASSAKAKPASIEAGRKSVQDALDRRGIPAVAFQPDWAKEADVGIFSHRFAYGKYPGVTIIVPTKDNVEVVKKCIDSLLTKTDYPNYKILIVDNESVDSKTIRYLQKISDYPKVSVFRIGNPDGRFNFANINNRAVESTDSEYVLFLNNDTEVLSKYWLRQMVGYAQIPGVGAVGARLLYPDKSVQHAGVIIKFYHGMAGHAFRGLPESDTGYLGYPRVLRNYSAVTAACLLTPKRLFLEIGGFDALNFGVAYNDVDYCHRLIEREYRVVYAAEAELIHHEGHSRGYGDDPVENVNFRQKYYGKPDVYYNPNLSLDNEFFEVESRAVFTGELNKTIKTLMCSHNLNHEGAPYSQYEMTVGLKNIGVIDPVVFSPSDGPLRELYESQGIRVVVDANLGNVFQMPGYRARVDAFASFIRMLGVEMVYANTLLNFHAIAAAREAGLPSIWNIRESEAWQHYIDWWGTEMADEAIRCFTYPYKVVFVAHTTKSLYHSFEARRNFTVIYNGLDLKRIFDEADKYSRKTVREELGVLDSETAILLPGTVCERKGQHDLVRALGMLDPDCLKSVKFFIVGDWLTPFPYGAELHALADSLPAAARARINIVPVTADIFKYYKAADIFVCTSRIESFPRIVLEAMAFGLPIITTPVFGIQEQVQPGVNAIFYTPGDVKTLATAIEKLVSDEKMRMKYAENSVHVLKQLGTFEDMVECYASVFKEGYLSGNGRPHMPEDIITCKAGREQGDFPIKKVSFLTTYADEFSQRFRVYNLIEELTAAGIEGSVIKEDFEGRLEGLFDSDLLVVFRVGLSENVSRILNEFKGRSIPTVFDIDDLVFEPELADQLHGLLSINESGKLSFIENMGHLRETLLACDYAICTTDALSKRIQALGKRCFVVPNAINKKQFDLAQALKGEQDKRDDNKVRIGYFSGTNTHDRDFLEASDALYEVMDRNSDAEFHLVGILDLDQRFSKFGDRVVRKPLMDYLDMLRYLSGMDINLAPLEMNNHFTAAKSELKIFEAALVAVPTVASPTESYAGCITDDVNGFLAATKEEWIEKLERLVRDDMLRHRVAGQAEKDFILRYYIKNVIEDVLDIYSQITSGHKTGHERNIHFGR